jgi:hypothetical protein
MLWRACNLFAALVVVLERGRGVGRWTCESRGGVPRLTLLLLTSLETTRKERVRNVASGWMLSQVKVAHIHTSSEQ